MNLFKVDTFRRDWFGYLNEQFYRTLLGLYLVWVIAVVAYVTVGHMPHRGAIFAACLAIRAVYECSRYGWRGWDTIEDSIFFVIYGIGGTMITFTGYQHGSYSAVFDMQIAFPMITVFFAHLSLGAFYRFNNNRRLIRRNQGQKCGG